MVFPNLQNTNKFAYDDYGAYINALAVILPTDDKFLVAILNSKLIWYFLTNICVVRNGGYIEVKPQYFEQIPIPEVSEDEAIKLTRLTDDLISDTMNNRKIKTKLLNLLKNKFGKVTITKKLDNWFDFSFSDLYKELKKQKISLTLSEESEWMEFFEVQVKVYSELKTNIQNLEKEIDRIIYELYGLTEEEIKIVERG
ncbi:MAG: TaqI-like C-terminal specificity domain-containing protein [Bacteroidota bacterium]